MNRRSATTKRRNGYSRFKALEAEIGEALVAGRTVVDVWEGHRVALAMSYWQFARYVRRLRAGAGRPPLAPAPVRRGSPHASAVHSARSLRDGPGEPSPRLNLDDLATRALRDDDLF